LIISEQLSSIVTEYSDIEIIECLRNRQSYVVRFLSDRYMPIIRLMVCQMGGTSEEARDIFQESLMIMLEKIDNKDFVLTCKFRTFLYCVCENLWKRVLAKKRVAENYLTSRVSTDSNSDFTELADKRLYETIFWDVYKSLDEVSRKILKLYWQEMSPKEIAIKLGYTYGYVRKKKCEAQAELTERVKRHPEYRRIIRSEIMAKDIVY